MLGGYRYYCNKTAKNGTYSLSKNSLFKNIILLVLPLYVFSASQLFSQPLADGKNKFLGNIITDGNNIASNYLKYWNQVTPGNAGKWGSIEYTPGSYVWTQLDNMYNYAISHNFPFKEHTLIWNTQQPSFMTNGTLDSLQLFQEIENWIKACAQRYPEAAYCDVVNEPLDHAPAYKDALGGNGATGWDWVIKSFELARKYWPPKTKLLINEYNVINDFTRNSKYIQIIKILQDRGLIDGIGVQAHSFEVNGPTIRSLQIYLGNLSATGLPVYISEFSINEADDNTQLLKYKSIFPVMYEEPGVKGVTIWGYKQYDMWTQEPNAYLITDRLAERPAMQWLRAYLSSYLFTELIAPNGTTGELRNPIFKWNAATAAKTYGLQISADSSFNSNVADTTVADTILQLKPLMANTKYFWRVRALNPGDTGKYSATANFTTGSQINSVEENGGIPAKYSLLQNYPNPFNPSTVIRYSIPKSGFVTLSVYNLLGQRISTLVNQEQEAGSYNVVFDASKLSGGVYFYKIDAGGYSCVRKMLLVK
jgi:endo-1,4-beta-xylanase